MGRDSSSPRVRNRPEGAARADSSAATELARYAVPRELLWESIPVAPLFDATAEQRRAHEAQKRNTAYVATAAALEYLCGLLYPGERERQARLHYAGRAFLVRQVPRKARPDRRFVELLKHVPVRDMERAIFGADRTLRHRLPASAVIELHGRNSEAGFAELEHALPSIRSDRTLRSYLHEADPVTDLAAALVGALPGDLHETLGMLRAAGGTMRVTDRSHRNEVIEEREQQQPSLVGGLLLHPLWVARALHLLEQLRGR